MKGQVRLKPAVIIVVPFIVPVGADVADALDIKIRVAPPDLALWLIFPLLDAPRAVPFPQALLLDQGAPPAALFSQAAPWAALPLVKGVKSGPAYYL